MWNITETLWVVLGVKYVDEQCPHYALMLCALCQDSAHNITGIFDVCILKSVKAMHCVWDMVI
jgi:hypothetical protein